MSKWWHNLTRGRRGGGTEYKGKLVDQDRYDWPFVSIERSGRSTWVLKLFARPFFDKRFEPPYFAIEFHGNARDAIEKGNEYNQREQDKWNEKLERLRAKKIRDHARDARDKIGGHVPGPIENCPVCMKSFGSKWPIG